MTLIHAYVAGPFSGKTRAAVDANIDAAIQCGIELARICVSPIIPHANTSHPAFETIQPYDFWIEATMDLMLQQDILFLMPNWAQSSGATKERAKAIEVGMPLFTNREHLKKALPDLLKLKQDFFQPLSAIRGHWSRPTWPLLKEQLFGSRYFET